MKPIRIENGIVIYYGNLAGRIRNGQAVGREKPGKFRA